MQDVWRVSPKLTVNAGLRWDYFEPVKPVTLLGDELTLAHSSKFMIDWVRDNLLDVLLQDLEAQLGRKCTVKFIVRFETSTIDRGIFQDAVLYDPTAGAPNGIWKRAGW